MTDAERRLATYEQIRDRLLARIAAGEQARKALPLVEAAIERLKPKTMTVWIDGNEPIYPYAASLDLPECRILYGTDGVGPGDDGAVDEDQLRRTLRRWGGRSYTGAIICDREGEKNGLNVLHRWMDGVADELDKRWMDGADDELGKRRMIRGIVGDECPRSSFGDYNVISVRQGDGWEEDFKRIPVAMRTYLAGNDFLVAALYASGEEPTPYHLSQARAARAVGDLHALPVLGLFSDRIVSGANANHEQIADFEAYVKAFAPYVDIAMFWDRDVYYRSQRGDSGYLKHAWTWFDSRGITTDEEFVEWHEGNQRRVLDILRTVTRA